MANLDKEEKELLDSYERDEWRPVPAGDPELERYREYAHSTLDKIRQALEDRVRRFRLEDSQG